MVDGTNTSEQHNINIYLDNVNIKTSAGSALQINNYVKATVTIYLTGINNLTTTNQSSAGLQKDNEAQLIITNASDTTTGILKASSDGRVPEFIFEAKSALGSELFTGFANKYIDNNTGKEKKL